MATLQSGMFFGGLTALPVSISPVLRPLILKSLPELLPQ